MAFPFKFGSEFLVNTTTAGNQKLNSVTGLADGRFVVSWVDFSASGGDTTGSAIRAQVFNADGSASGGEFLVNTTTAGFQAQPAITGLADGRFVVSWSDNSATGGDTSSRAIRAQVFNADGSPSGAEFLVNTTTVSFQSDPSITALADGRFVVSWVDSSETGGDTSNDAIRAQVFNADGSPSGAEFLVNTTTVSFQSDPSVTGLADGRFVVSWSDVSQTGGDTSSSAIRAQVFNADGSASGGEFLVNTTTAGFQAQPAITGLADGRFVVSWTDESATGGDTASSAVRAQVFNADGSPSGTEFLVNTIVAGPQFGSSVTALADGRFVVSWSDQSQSGGDPSSNAVRAQVFNIDGSLAGDEFLINSTTTTSQAVPSITALADGRFVVTWQDASATGGDLSGDAIRGQIFDPRESAVMLSGSLLDDDYVGTRYGDQIYGFIGDDDLTGRSGDDFLFGERGDDTLRGNAGNDRLYGGDDDDLLIGGLGADQLLGGNGNDNLNGGFGLDYMEGGAGDDTYTVDVVGDLVIENAGGGTDTVRSGTMDLKLGSFANVENLGLTGALDLNLFGRNNDNILVGNDGANTIKGRGGADKIEGKGGNDSLFGEAGADKIIGGNGRDRLTGGADADRFIYKKVSETGTSAATRDQIRDFSQAEGDRIDLSKIDAASAGGNQAFTFIGNTGFSSTEGELRFVQTGSRTLVQGDIDGDSVKDFEIELTGLHVLVAGDFLL